MSGAKTKSASPRRSAAASSASSDPASPTPPTLAALVRGVEPGVSWDQARALCRAGRVEVDGRVVGDPAWRPPLGCRIEVVSAATAATAASERRRASSSGRAGDDEVGDSEPGVGKRQAERAELRDPSELVVYADADVVVVRKAAGILSVPFERGDRDTLLALTRVALRRMEARRAERAQNATRQVAGGRAPSPTLRAVQRLDKETSGLIVFARHVAAQRHLQGQLARREVVRRYEAVVHGVAHDTTYESWLVDDRGDGLRGSWRSQGSRGAARAAHARAAAAGTSAPPPPEARQAVTHVRVLARLRGAAHVACELETGRQHQIRIHLAEDGHPLAGETVYIRDYRGPQIAALRPMLHAASLGFRHPRDERFLFFEEPPPADFALLLEKLRRR